VPTLTIGEGYLTTETKKDENLPNCHLSVLDRFNLLQ